MILFSSGLSHCWSRITTDTFGAISIDTLKCCRHQIAMIESVLQTCWPHHDIICWTLCFANDLIWPSKYKLRCNTSNPDCSPMIDLPPWASLVMFIASLLVNIWGELFQHVCQHGPSSISLYIISTLLVYSYVNFLSQITVLTFLDMTSLSRHPLGVYVTTYHCIAHKIAYSKIALIV